MNSTSTLKKKGVFPIKNRPATAPSVNNSWLKYLGVGFIIIGVVLFLVLHLYHLTFVNLLILIPLLLVLLGIFLHTWAVKDESAY